MKHPEIRFCQECGGPLIRYVWQLRRRDPRKGPPDVAIPKPIETECLYRCSPEFVRSRESVEAVA